MQHDYNYYTVTDASEIIIDEEFMRILPVLNEKELASIEKSILNTSALNRSNCGMAYFLMGTTGWGY